MSQSIKGPAFGEGYVAFPMQRHGVTAAPSQGGKDFWNAFKATTSPDTPDHMIATEIITMLKKFNELESQGVDIMDIEINREAQTGLDFKIHIFLVSEQLDGFKSKLPGIPRKKVVHWTEINFGTLANRDNDAGWIVRP